MLIYQDDKYNIYQTDDGQLIIIKKDDSKMNVFEKEIKKVA